MTTFLLALVPLATVAGLIALYVRKPLDSDARFAARNRIR